MVGSYLEGKIGVQLCKLSFPSGSGMPIVETSLEQSHAKAYNLQVAEESR